MILENHLHVVASSMKDLGEQMQRFKSFTARQIIDYLKSCKATRLLGLLAYLKKSYKTESAYQFWEEGSHPQVIQGDDMMFQKLEYIHNNPVKRGYVDDPLHWRYSSARNYAGMEPLLPVETDWR